MGVIGKVYANSMLVVINSRMQLGPKETSLEMISILQFGTAPVNNESGVAEAHRGDISVDRDGMTSAPVRSQEV